MQVLDCSKRRAVAQLKKRHPVTLKRSQLCKRVRRCRLAVASHTVARGKCDACLSWSRYGRKKLQGIYDEAFKLINAVCPDYWTAWHARVERDHLDVYHLEAPDNPDYILGMIEFVGEHEHTHQELRSTLDADSLMHLVACEASLISQLEPEVEDVKNIAWHYSLKRSVDLLFQAHWTAPKPKTQYAIWDQMAP